MMVSKKQENTVGYTESDNYRCLEDLDTVYNMRSMNPLNLFYCGWERCEPGWKFWPYIRENYVIHVVTEGKGRYTTGSQKAELSKGKMFLIYPGEEAVYEADHDDPWTYMWIGFNGHMAESVVKEIGFLRTSPVREISNTSEISNAIDLIMDSRQITMADGLKRMAAFYYVLSLMMDANKKNDTERNYPEAKYVNAAVEIIASSYSEQLRIADIADRVGINRSYLTSIFKREMHMSPQAFLINIRLENAARLLKETEESVGSIAAAVGYTDALAFSKAFKQKYNSTPSEFRRSSIVLEQMNIRGSYTGNHKL